MDMLLVSIFDKVAKEYSSPNVCKNKEVAMRQFQGEMTRMPEYARGDYELVKLGVMNMETGKIESGVPVKIEESVDE